MPLKHGNREGEPIRTSEKAREMGSKGGKKSQDVQRLKRERRAALLAAFGVEPITAEMVRMADSALLAMTAAQLQELSEKEEMPVYLRRRALVLLQKNDLTAFEVTERILDRAFGKPKQQVEMEQKQKPPIVILPDEEIVQDNE